MRRQLTQIWTVEQVEQLKTFIAKNATPLRTASALKRSIISVQSKARDLGTPFPHKRALKRAQLAREISEKNSSEGL